MKVGEPPTVRAPDIIIIITREVCVAANPSRLAAADVLVDGNYEHVAGDIAGTVTVPSPGGSTLTLDALITR